MLSSLFWQPWGPWMTLVPPCPSACARIAPGAYSLYIRFISRVITSRASSQEILTYLLLPLFWGFLSPSGFQSVRLSGYKMRLGEKTRFLYAIVIGGINCFMVGLKTCPRASIFHGFRCSALYFQSKWKGLMRTILPFLTSTWIVLPS